MERRTLTMAANFEHRSEGDKKFISGYFAVFNSTYQMCPGISESIAPGAFDETINDDIRCLIDHESRLVLGRTKAGTYKLRIDAKGLWGEVEINQKDSDAMNLYHRVQRKDVDQCSIGFEILQDSVEHREDGSCHWTIEKLKLYEGTVCTFPAYEETSVEARSRQKEHLEKRQFEQRKAELSKRLEELKC